jgi:transcriptional regulator with XRE-family HTH domain
VTAVRETVTTAAQSAAAGASTGASTVASSVPAVGSQVGEFIRTQRSAAQVSLRELARTAGVSNPYLSQVERGLRKPSAEILQQLAKGLRISAEQLYMHAGILDERDDSSQEFATVVMADPSLSERQKSVLMDVYDSFRKENEMSAGTEAGTATGTEPTDTH